MHSTCISSNGMLFVTTYMNKSRSALAKHLLLCLCVPANCVCVLICVCTYNAENFVKKLCKYIQLSIVVLNHRHTMQLATYVY